MSVVVCFGEVMLRLTPPGYTRYSQTQSFDVAFGGAENNVAVSTACFGDQSRMITKLPNNAIADMFMQQMRSVGVLEPGALVVIEHAAAVQPNPGPGYRMTDQRKYRDTMITFYRYEEQQDGGTVDLSGQF